MAADYASQFDVFWDTIGGEVACDEDVARRIYKQALKDALNLYDCADPWDRDMQEIVFLLEQAT